MQKTVYVAGHNGMVGSAIVRRLKKEGIENLILRTKDELDLTRQQDVEEFLKRTRPDVVIVAAAKVGGINANNLRKAQFLYENLMIETNVINSSFHAGVEKLIFLGSSCVYPKFSEQPIKEEYLLKGALEPTNEGYSLAKIAGIKLCEYLFEKHSVNFFSLMPTNLYGQNDLFNLEDSHVIPALIRKMHDAKLKGHDKVSIWGSGKPTREFLYVDDLADAIYFSLVNINANDIYSLGISQLNIGTGVEVSINQLAETIRDVVQYEGNLEFDFSNPDGMPKRLLDVSRVNKFGWKHTTNLPEGLKVTYSWFQENISSIRL